jgi:DNA-binding MarR family transcriptional regulator
MKQVQLKTFEAGILQARAYRNLRVFMQDNLEKHQLTMMQWALLGTIADAGEGGITINDLARTLDVEGSIITNMVNTAVKSGVAQKRVHPADNRSRIVVATKTGQELVEKVEAELRVAMRAWLKGVPRAALFSYLRTLERIANL